LADAAWNSVLAGIVKKDAEMKTTMQIEIENLKCGGCERSILKGLGAMDEISDIMVNQKEQWVQFAGSESIRPKVADKLLSMGYPEKGSLTGLDAGLANAKSFVSCVIGRVS
jgi:copper chaperone